MKYRFTEYLTGPVTRVVKAVYYCFVFTLLLVAGRIHAAELPAVVHYAQVVELAVPVSGIVGDVHVNSGQRIDKGTLMLELDETPFMAELNRSEAEIRRLTAEQDEIRKALDRDLELYDRMVLSTVDLDRRKLQFIQADSRLKAEQSQLALAKYHYTGSKLHAPFNGMVISSNAYPGMSVHVELKPPVLFQFANTEKFSVEADAAADKISGLGIGETVKVEIGGQAYSGKVNNINLTSEGHSLSQPSRYRVKVLLQGAADLMPGQAARIITSQVE